MIHKLVLRNFQAHEALRLEFDPRITAITGASDVGKSAIIRALAWVALNEPGGLEFLKHGADKVFVSLTVDGKRVRRIRTASSNVYKIEDKEFKAFGADVPPEVAQLLGLSPINFQFQHDAPFWFQTGGGEVSRQLNQVVDLSVIDQSLSFVAKKLRSARATLEVCEQRSAQAAEKAKELSFAEEFDRDLQQVEKLKQRMDKTEGAKISLHEDIQTAVELRARAKVELPDFSELDNLAACCRSRGKTCGALRSLIESADELRARVQRLEAAAQTAEAELHKQAKGKCPICGGKL